jgi:hypothetical protein
VLQYERAYCDAIRLLTFVKVTLQLAYPLALSAELVLFFDQQPFYCRPHLGIVL